MTDHYKNNRTGVDDKNNMKLSKNKKEASCRKNNDRNSELERKVVELSRLNDEISNLLTSSKTGAIFLDKEMKIQRFIPAATGIIDLRPTDVGRPISRFMNKLHYDNLVDDVQKVLKTSITVETEVHLNKDNYIWMRILSCRTRNDTIEGVIITFTDISEQKKSQVRAEANEQKYKMLLQNMSGAVIINELVYENGMVTDSVIIEVNDAYLRLTETKRKDITGKRYKEVFPHYRKDLFNRFVDVVRTGSPFCSDEFSRQFNKHLNIAAYKFDQNKFILILDDITRVKKEILSSRQLASIVESSQDAIYSISLDAKILTWNKGAERFYGYKAEEIIGKEVSVLFRDADQDGHIERIRKVEKGKKYSSFESFQKTKAGRIIPVFLTKSPILDENGNVVAISDIVKDITGIKEREEELIKAKEKTERSGLLKTAFLQNVSHEIRTPMNAILGFNEILKDRLVDPADYYYTAVIEESGSQLIRIIDDILVLSRIEADELTIEKNAFVLDELMHGLEEKFREMIKYENIGSLDLKLVIPGDGHVPLLYTDEERLQQVIANLLSNAVKYTDQGSIEFGYKIVKNDLLFFVKDTGKGIEKSNHEIIFDRFSRLDPEKKKLISGTGLGLSISRGLVSRLGGKIWVESEPGKGSTFFFTIPYEESDTEIRDLKRDGPEDGRVPDLSGRTILIAEDDKFSYQMMEVMLAETNVNILYAEDGDEAVKMLENNDIELALLDIRLPKKSGYEILEAIREKEMDIKVVAQTAYAMPEEKKRSLKAGFDEHLTKPLSSKELYRVLRKFMLSPK